MRRTKTRSLSSSSENFTSFTCMYVCILKHINTYVRVKHIIGSVCIYSLGTPVRYVARNVYTRSRGAYNDRESVFESSTLRRGQNGRSSFSLGTAACRCARVFSPVPIAQKRMFFVKTKKRENGNIHEIKQIAVVYGNIVQS